MIERFFFLTLILFTAVDGIEDKKKALESLLILGEKDKQQCSIHSEELMQNLLSLDSVQGDGDIRESRKSLVLRIQGLMRELDVMAS